MKDKKTKAKLEAQLKTLQEQLQALEKAADMKKWCEVPKEEVEKNKDVTAKKNKKSKKTRKKKNKK